MPRRLLALGLGCAIACAASTASANPLDPFGFGSRETAMGSAVSADVSDFSACYYNPAGLAKAHGFELSIGYFRADHFLNMNGQNNGVDPVKGMIGGAVVPGKLFDFPFAIGVGFHVPDDRLTRVRALSQDQPRWEMYDNRNQRLWFGVNAAISPVPWLQLGGGVTFMAATIATLDISGDVDLFKPYDSSLRHQVNADLSLVAYPDFGARIELSDAIALAVVYRGQFKLDLNVGANVNAGVGVGAASSTIPGASGDLTRLRLALATETVDSFLPQQVVVGWSWKLSDDLKANLDLTWVNWSAYIPPVTAIHTTLDVPPPKGGWPAGIKPPTAPAPISVLPIQIEDRIVPHLGAEWRAIARPSWQGFLRGGYEYDKSPIGPQTGQTNYVDRDRHAFSAGIGVRFPHPATALPGDLRFDVHGQLSVLPTGTTLKQDPSDLVGDYTAGGHIWNVGATATVGFYVLSTLFLPLAMLGTIACGTIASPGSGDLNLPTADVGPFTPLAEAEVAAGDIPPFVFLNQSAQYREPSAIAASGDTSGPGVILFAVATTSSGDVIVRTRADDGVSFYGDTVDQQNHPQDRPPLVLRASQPWEGGDLSGPSVLRVGSAYWLYYAAAGGIGLAKSTDGGLTFQAQPQPVLAADHGSGWEFTPPRAPTVAQLPDGSFDMLYTSGDAIGEAVSADGETGWKRVDGDPTTPALDPVLLPSAHVDPSTLPTGVLPPFDEGAVDDPLLVPSVDVAGRLVVRVLYTGYSAPIGAATRVSAIGVAARYGTSGAFTKQSSPVYSVQSGEAAPALLQFGGDQALLYVQQLNSTLDMAHPFLAIAAAYAPASGMSGAPGAFPTTP